jgi:hypothetical protein
LTEISSQPSAPSAGRTIFGRLLHVWRVALVCAVLTRERGHPALAVLILVPLNHFLFRLTGSLRPPIADPSTRSEHGWLATLRQTARGRAGLVVGFYLLASCLVIWWYGSFQALRDDVAAFSRTGEFWAIAFVVSVLTVLYRPLVTSLGHLVGATGLRDTRLWSALLLAIGVWVWCAGVFAGLYQQLSLLCDRPEVGTCAGRAFSQPLTHFADAAYFSTVTLSTAGFGDIVPVSRVARAMVSLEIVIGYGLLGFLLSRVAGFRSDG